MSENDEDELSMSDMLEAVKGCSSSIRYQRGIILKLCGITIGNLDGVIGTSQRTSPRTLDNLEPAVLKELVPKLTRCLDECRHFLTHTLPFEFDCLTSALDNLDSLSSEAITAHETSISICPTVDQATDTLDQAHDTCDQVLNRVVCLDQKLTELTKLHNVQLKELQDLKSTITALPPPITSADFNHVHSIQMKELEGLAIAVKSQPPPVHPVLDYTKIKFPPLPRPPPLSSPPIHQPIPPVSFKKQMRKSSNEIEKRNNVMVYGLAVDNYSAKSSVLKMFRQCGVEGLSSVADNIVSAHVVGTNGAHPAVRVVMSNHWIVNEVLTVARQLKTTTYSHVYLSKDRTPEERERHKKCVDELKQKMSDCPDRRWAILRGCVVDKGQFVTHGH